MKYIFLLVTLFVATHAWAQVKPKTTTQPKKTDAEKMMEEMMKDSGMSEEEKEMMKDIMKGMSPDKTTPSAAPVDFTDNRSLIPSKDAARIRTINLRTLSDNEIATQANSMYTKLMAKAPAADKSLINTTLTKAKTAGALRNASVIALLQGQHNTSMALAMKAVAAEPGNINNQNNLAGVLTQSGYPEKALPILYKLQQQLPANSTVLNNTALAWMQLGEADSAWVYATAAWRLNPENPETNISKGVAEESKGNKTGAEQYYERAHTLSPNDFTEKLLKNNNGKYNYDMNDFNKLKKMITIYEYFPYNWIEIPIFSNNVDGSKDDEAIRTAYLDIIGSLEDKIDELKTLGWKDLDELTADDNEKDDDDEYIRKKTPQIKGLAAEYIKGINFMSKPAMYITMTLEKIQWKWMEQYLKEHEQLKNIMKRHYKEVDAVMKRKDSKCPDWDQAHNRYMRTVNPIIRQFHKTKIEEYRQIANAYCTWIWYLVGNPANVMLTKCLDVTQTMLVYHKNAISDLQAHFKHCVNLPDKIKTIKGPELPQFECPIVVSMPVGMAQLKMMAGTNSFDNNIFGIGKKSGTSMPNITVGFGIDEKSIPEPGKDGTPMMKTTENSVAPGQGNDDDELAPLLTNEQLAARRDAAKPSDAQVNAAIDKRLGELLKKANEYNSAVDRGLSQRLKAIRSKMLMDNFRSTDCNLKKENPNGLKDRVRAEDMVKMIDAMLEQGEEDAKQAEIKKMQEKIKKTAAIAEEIFKDFDEDELAPLMNFKKEAATLQQAEKELNNLPALKGSYTEIKNNLRKNGMVAAISNGIQPPGSIIGFIKGLLD